MNSSHHKDFPFYLLGELSNFIYMKLYTSNCDHFCFSLRGTINKVSADFEGVYKKFAPLTMEWLVGK